MKILNLYAGIGGNRKLWGDEHNITAVEIREDIAAVYKSIYRQDILIVGDAHKYLKEHFSEFDFIWASPPCQTHGSFRQNICVNLRGTQPEYPDMKLYQEIIFLKHNFNGNWVVENVKPYYDFLIYPDFSIQRHCYWSNVKVPKIDIDNENLREVQIPELQKIHGINLDKYKVENKRQVLRNCVSPEIGKYILDYIMGCSKLDSKQLTMFE